MYKNLPYHYWHLHKEAVSQVWDSLSDSLRDAVSSDLSNNGYEFNKFVENVNKVAYHKFNNPYHPSNDKYTFKYPC
jgi:hypothetical protein